MCPSTLLSQQEQQNTESFIAAKSIFSPGPLFEIYFLQRTLHFLSCLLLASGLNHIPCFQKTVLLASKDFDKWVMLDLSFEESLLFGTFSESSFALRGHRKQKLLQEPYLQKLSSLTSIGFCASSLNSEDCISERNRGKLPFPNRTDNQNSYRVLPVE